MKKRFLTSGIAIALIAFLAGYLFNSSRGAGTGTAQRKILYYVDPMHPAYKSDKPGIAPDCGMQLEPVYADGGPAGGATTPPQGLPPGSIMVSADRQQLIGVKTMVVDRAEGGHTIKTVGRVAPDENRQFRVLAALDGFVTKVSQVTTGDHVTRDQYLATLYSVELYALINTYIFSLNSIDRSSSGFNTETNTFKKIDEKKAARMRNDVNVRNQRTALVNVGMSETQLEEIFKTRYNRNELDLRSIASGYVLARNIALGERFERGRELYRIADLSKVWVLADIYENEAEYYKPGMKVTIQVPQQKRTFTGRVRPVLPVFDPISKTLKLQIEVDNRDILLQPGMFVTVEIQAMLPAMITVPTEAVLDSGLRKTIFVDRGNGWFEPRQVETGRSLGDRVEIIKGVAPGEKIVVSGNFLLDSETRLKNAAAGIYGKPGKDPVCGMALDEDRAKSDGLTRQYGGKTYYFCSPEDMTKFDKAPQRYTGPNAVVEPMTMPPGSPAMPMGHGESMKQTMPGMKKSTMSGMGGGSMAMPERKTSATNPPVMQMERGDGATMSKPGTMDPSGKSPSRATMPMKVDKGASPPVMKPAAAEQEPMTMDPVDNQGDDMTTGGDADSPSLSTNPTTGELPNDK